MSSSISILSDYNHRSLMDILNASSSSHISINTFPSHFIGFLQSTFLVSEINDSTLDKWKPCTNNNGVNNYKTITNYSNEFNDSYENFNLNLFNILIGEKNLLRIQNYSICQLNRRLNCLLWINGKHLRFDSNESSKKSTERLDDWYYCRPMFESIIDASMVSFGHMIVKNVVEASNDTFYCQYRLDKQMETNFRQYTNKYCPINRIDMFYSRQSSGRVLLTGGSIVIGSGRDSMHRNFPFIPNDSMRKAYREIFGAKGQYIKTDRSHRLDKYLLEIRENILQTNFQSLVEHCCPLNENGKNIFERQTKTKQMNQLIHSILHRIIPMFIKQRNYFVRAFSNNLKQILTSCYLSTFRVWDIIHNIQMNLFKSLFQDLYEDINVFVQENELEILFFCWLFRIVKHIIRTKFYITECRQLKYKLLFFRHDLWARLSDKTIYANIKANHWSRIVASNAIECDDLSQYLQHSSLRFIPKRNGLRPITRLCFARFHQSNKKLRREASNIVQFLKALNGYFRRNFECGSEVYDLQEKLLNLKMENLQRPKYFIVRGDFQNCYQSINLTKLMSIILWTIHHMTKGWNCERVIIGNYRLPVKLYIDNVKIIKKYGNSFVKKRRMIFRNLHLDQNTYRCVFKQTDPQMVRNAFIDLATSESCELDTKKVIVLLRVYLSKSFIHVGRKSCYRFIGHGIRQGGPLSDELCQIYMNFIWKNILNQSSLTKEDLFFTFVDDFLLITSDLEKARNFRMIMLNDIENKYDLSVNPNKICTNFDEQGNLRINHSIEFLGRLFQIDQYGELAIRRDYESFAELNIQDCFNCNPMAPLLYHMKMLSANITNKCHPELFDCRLNRLAVVAENIYQRFMLQAMKLGCLMSKLQHFDSSMAIHSSRHVCLFIYHMSKRFYRSLQKWPIEMRLSEIHIHLIAAHTFKVLWNTKLKHRPKIERSIIENYYLQLKMYQYSSQIDLESIYRLPERLMHPFYQIRLK